MSENIPEVPEIIKQIRMNNPDDEKKPRKIGCLTYGVVIVIMIGVLVWFNFFRPGPPLRISKETTYITEPLTADGRYVDYVAALQQNTHPPEMQTDANGFRVVFRALGDFNNKTRDFIQLQKRYEALGLDALHDTPTMTFVEPSTYFNKRYISHPEEFEDIVAAEKEKYVREIEESLRKDIEEIKADPDMIDEEKAESIAYCEEQIAYHKMSEEEKRKFEDQEHIQQLLEYIETVKADPDMTDEKKAESIAFYEETIAYFNMSIEERKENLKADIEKTKSDPEMSEEDKEQRIAQLQLDFDDLDNPAVNTFDLFGFTFEPLNAFLSLSNSQTLHKNAIVRKWLEENNAALDLVAEQVKKPIFVAPYIKGEDSFAVIGMPLPDVTAMRSFARGLQARAQIRLGDGDIDGAIDNIVACYQLGRHAEKGATLVEGLVGMSIEGIADSLAYDIGETRANAEQLKRLQNEIVRLSPQKGYLHKLESERYMCLDCMLSVMKGAPFPISPMVPADLSLI